MAQSAPLYKQTAKLEIGGEGGWDYITYNSDSNRLFVGHNMEITVIDVATGKKTGSVPANGAHGVAPVVRSAMRFRTAGRAGRRTRTSGYAIRNLASCSGSPVRHSPPEAVRDSLLTTGEIHWLLLG